MMADGHTIASTAIPYFSLNNNEACQRSSARKAPRAYKDVAWLVAFVVHLAVVAALAAAFCPELIARARDEERAMTGANATAVDPDVAEAIRDATRRGWPFLAIGVGAAFAWSVVWIVLVQCFAERLIEISLVCTPLVLLGLTLWPGSPAVLATGVGFLLTAFYAFWMFTSQRARIVFAKLTLECVAGVLRRFPGTWILSLLSIAPAVVWQLGWLLALGGTAHHYGARAEQRTVVDARGRATTAYSVSGLAWVCGLFLLFSNYWTAQVIQNVVHVANAGVVGTWYFRQADMPARPVAAALGRALSTSFGSICLGSLLVALVQLIHDLAEWARTSQDNALGACVMCCVACFIGWIEALVELFNHWAFVQVALYGKDFKTAAKDTWHLVSARGLSALINMSLTSQAVGLGVSLGALLTGALVAALAYQPLYAAPRASAGLAQPARDVYGWAYGLLIAFCALCALVFTTMVSATVTSGVTTLFVCWAEDPAALQRSNPALHEQFARISSRFLDDHPYEPRAPPPRGAGYAPRMPPYRPHERGADPEAGTARPQPHATAWAARRESSAPPDYEDPAVDLHAPTRHVVYRGGGRRAEAPAETLPAGPPPPAVVGPAARSSAPPREDAMPRADAMPPGAAPPME